MITPLHIYHFSFVVSNLGLDYYANIIFLKYFMYIYFIDLRLVFGLKSGLGLGLELG